MATNVHSNSSHFPILRVIAGMIFIAAGLVYFSGFSIRASFALIFVIAGVAVIFLTFTGRRAYPADIALFVIAILVLGAASVGPTYSNNNQTVVYSALKSAGNFDQIDLMSSSNVGSISISYTSNNDSLAYQVTFESSVFSFPLLAVGPSFQHTFSNVTRDGILFLNASSSASSLIIVIGKGYTVNVNATTSAGSISLNSPQSEKLGRVSLSADSGSVDARISSSSISGISLKAAAGSVSLESDYLSPSGPRIPISASTSAGSISLNLGIAHSTAVSVTATDSLGSISHNLVSPFAVSQSSNSKLQASAGDIASASQSFVVTASANLGSISINAHFA